MTDNKRNGEQPGALRVGPSPLNAVKLELGIIIMLALLLLFVVNSITERTGDQLLILAGFAIAAALWLVGRARYILKRFHQDPTR